MTSVHFDIQLLDCLRGHVTKGSLDALELSADTQNALVRMGVTKLGQLIDVACSGRLLSLRISRNTRTEVQAALNMLTKSVRPNGRVNWRTYKVLRSMKLQANPEDQFSIAGKVATLSNESLQRLSADSRAQGLSTLHLSARTIHSLARKGIRSIGEFVDSAAHGIAELRGAGRKSLNEIIDSLKALSGSVTADGTVDWIAYANERGFRILPKKGSATPSSRSYIRILRPVIRAAVKSRFRAKELLVFEDYFLRKNQMALPEIGTRLGQTRQGAALLKDKGLAMLRNAIWSGAYEGCRFRFRDIVCLPLVRLKNCLEETQDGWLLLYRQWEEGLKKAWGVTPSELAGLEKLILALLGYRLLHRSQTNHMSVVIAANRSAGQVFSAIRRAQRLLKIEFPAGLTERELFEKLQGRTPASAILRQLIRSIPGLEQTSPRGRLRFRIQRLPRMSDQLERILKEAGKPMHLRDLAQEMRRFPESKGSKRHPVNVRGAMSSDKRFAPIGRSGHWSLAEWNVERRSITEIAHEILQSARSPLTEMQMYSLIASKRPVAPSSIGRLLIMDARFRRVAPCTWELKGLR